MTGRTVRRLRPDNRRADHNYVPDHAGRSNAATMTEAGRFRLLRFDTNAKNFGAALFTPVSDVRQGHRAYRGPEQGWTLPRH